MEVVHWITSTIKLISMDRKEIIEGVNDVIIANLAVDDDYPLNEDTKLVNLGMDSLDYVECIIELERRFKINIDEDKLMYSVSNITCKFFYDLVDELTNK